MKQVQATFRTRVFGGLGAALALAMAASADTLVYVDDDAPAGGNGASWVSAYRFLQDAIANALPAPGETITIRIAQGTYHPDETAAHPNGTGNQQASFTLKNRVALEGGYAGAGAPDPDARDIGSFITTLSGDLAGNDQPGFINFDENSYIVVKAMNVDESASLDGLTVQGANPQASSNGGVGAVYSHFGDFTIVNCRIKENLGTGMRIESSSPSISTCEFSGNAGRGLLGIDDGEPMIHECSFLDNKDGGAWVQDSCDATFTECTFAGNTATKGAGFVNYTDSHSTLTDCEFHDNTATVAGGALFVTESHLTAVRCGFENNASGGKGGAADLSWDNLVGVFTDCVFVGNTAATYGGAIATYQSSTSMTGCIIQSNSAQRGGAIYGVCALANCLVYDNAASQRGGAILSRDEPSTLRNCTIVQNHSPLGPAAYVASSGGVKLFNSIVRGNGGHPFDGFNAITAKYCNIYPAMPGSGNISASPKFVSSAAGDFRLKPGSPCIDAGKNSQAPAGIALDLLGNPRFIDVPNIPDSGVGSPPLVDMGAYEFQVP